jgi:hypothetical protein
MSCPAVAFIAFAKALDVWICWVCFGGCNCSQFKQSKHQTKAIINNCPQKKRADPFKGDSQYAIKINQHLLSKDLAAKQAGLDPLDADFEWQTFVAAKPDLVNRLIAGHPQN